jgi:NADH-quinone oxidoreductase subunit J
VERALFYVFGALAVVSAAWMITRRSPLASALSLVVALLALAGLYAVLDAHLLFVIQIWVYAGAVMVLVLFVIMLLNLREEEARGKAIGLWRVAVGGLVAVAVAWKAFGPLHGEQRELPRVPEDFGSVAAVAEILFSQYIVHFQIVGVLLLAVTVGVVVLAKRRI